MTYLKVGLSVLFLSVFIFLGQWGWAPLPPLGLMLNPFNGIWRNSPASYVQGENETSVSGLKAGVEISWDEHGIPHVFANNNHDIYWAQGYLIAAERLWQMDLHTRVAAGRLSEMVGSRTVQRDQFFVRLGLRRAAQRAIEELLKDPESSAAIKAYTAGVNAFINQLDRKNLPAEYKILGAWPEPWTEIRTAYLLKIMSFGLSGRTFDVELSHLLKKYGHETVLDLFPDLPAAYSPVIHDMKDLRSVLTSNPAQEMKNPFITEFDDYFVDLKPAAGNGSNNWAVSGKKTVSGYPIVANDTHLGYTLPNIWYEMQLTTPEMNVYGATFPAAPGIIIGFNDHISWAVTNASADVIDFYELEFKDETFSEYRVGEEWFKSEKQTEVIVIKGQPSKEEELIWTQLGVVVAKNGKKGLTLRWIAHDPSYDLVTFLKLNRAQNYDECKEALKFYSAPSQNFICADSMNIGIWQNGRFPKKRHGQGRYVMDGSLARNAWNDWIEWQNLPHVENPPSGYVRSANQHPVNGKYPYSFGWYFYDSYRAQRIEEVLGQDTKFTAEDMRHLQNDEHDKFAEEVLPFLLKSLNSNGADDLQKKILRDLHQWDFKNRADSKPAAVFYTWWLKLEDRLWRDQFTRDENGDRLHYPMRSRSVELIKSPNSKRNADWIDDITTPEKIENLSDLVSLAWSEGLAELRKKHGVDYTQWELFRVKSTKLPHLGRMPGFGSDLLTMGGGEYSVNANKGWHGAVWRMVVELGPKVKAWTNYPGGPSGNPFDKRYSSFISSWSQGELRPVRFWSKEPIPKEEIRGTWKLTPEENE